MDRFGGAIFPHRLDSSINSRDFPALSEPFSGIFQLNSPARTVSEIGQERERERGIYKPLEQKCVGRRRRGKKSDKGCWFEAAKRKNGSRNVTSGVKPWTVSIFIEFTSTHDFYILGDKRLPSTTDLLRRRVFPDSFILPLASSLLSFVCLSFDRQRSTGRDCPVRGGGEGWPLSLEKS